MKTKIITVATRDDQGLRKLISSLRINGEKLEVLGKGTRWKGFGTKIILLRDYLRTLEDYTHFIFVDAYDVIFLDNLQSIENVYNQYFKDEIIFSTEKNCWPQPDLASSYPENKSLWKYLNSGSYMAPVDKFLELIEKYSVSYADDDQLYFTNIFLNGGINLDYDCKIFQSYSFVAEGEFLIDTQFMNNITGTKPSIIHGNGKTDMSEIYKISDNKELSSVEDIVKIWQPTLEYNKNINEAFIEKVNNIPVFKKHRDWVENNAWGFGERSFYWMWQLLIKEMPQNFTFLEIGVFRGAILSLVRIISDSLNKKVTRYGVTPLSPAEVGWVSDYGDDIKKIHNTFDVSDDYIIIKGDSTDPETIKQAEGLQLDLLYIDGCHSKFCVQSDIKNYTPLLKVGGYLVIDDSASLFKMPFGYFTGISTVCEGVDELLPPAVNSNQYEHLFNIVHNRVWKKIK